MGAQGLDIFERENQGKALKDKAGAKGGGEVDHAIGPPSLLDAHCADTASLAGRRAVVLKGVVQGHNVEVGEYES